VKHLIRLWCADAVPTELLRKIPSSCVSRWKYESNEKYVGCELNSIAKEKLELIQDFAKSKNAQRVFVAYGRLVNTLVTIVTEAKEYSKMIRQVKEKVVEVIDQCSQTLSVSKCLKVFRISSSTYQHWLVQVKAKCDPSALLLCKRKYQRKHRLQ